MTELSPAQRAYLKRLAHPIKPLVHIGKGGVTATLQLTVNQVLTAHELVKIKFVGSKEEKDALVAELVSGTHSALVGIIGNTAILYRQHPQKDQRKIVLP
jgi:RNA-binding protein